LATALVAGLGACGGDASAAIGRNGKDIKQLPADLLPPTVLNLRTAREDMQPSLAGSKNAYVDAVGLYSFRTEDDVLRATLQVSHFIDNPQTQKAAFRNALVAKIGGTRPRTVRLGEDTVYLTTGAKQQIAIWFRGRQLMVLSESDDFDRPRSLLRATLGVKL
jgi:hypothetical protein